ncbi:hypothetical protein KRMM14A1004_37700 [Krasilnikovia sp. MM14-A1004]
MTSPMPRRGRRIKTLLTAGAAAALLAAAIPTAMAATSPDPAARPGTSTVRAAAADARSRTGLLTTLDWEQEAERQLPPPGWIKQYCCGKSVRIVDAPTRDGHHAVQFTLDKGDPDVSSSTRAEFSQPDRQPAGVERWYGFSLNLPADWRADRSSEIVSQWHHQGNNGSPPLALLTNNGHWKIDFRGSIIDLGPYQTGRWTDWVFHVTWRTDSGGRLEVWRDGGRVLDRTGATHDDGANSPYFKFGIYKWDWDGRPKPSDTTHRSMVYDALRIGDRTAGYADVAPGPAAPPSPPRPSGPPPTAPGSCLPTAVVGGGWVNKPVGTQRGRFTTTLGVTPSRDRIDALVTLAPAPGTRFTDQAALVRFNPSGVLDVRDGSGYRYATKVPYRAGQRVDLSITVDVPARRYDVDVLRDGTATPLARGAAFRTEQASATSIGTLGVVVAGDAGTLRACDVTSAVTAPGGSGASGSFVVAAAGDIAGECGAGSATAPGPFRATTSISTTPADTGHTTARRPRRTGGPTTASTPAHGTSWRWIPTCPWARTPRRCAGSATTWPATAGAAWPRTGTTRCSSRGTTATTR